MDIRFRTPSLLIYALGFLIVCTDISTSPALAAQRQCLPLELELHRLGAKFFHKNNPKLHLTADVEKAARQLLEPKDLQVAEKKIAAWIALVEKTHAENANNPAAMHDIREHYHRIYVIKESEFPESHFELRRRIAREQGRGEINLTPQMRRELMNTAIEGQKLSLNAWIDYLHSSDALYPTWAKIWALEGISKRAKGTVGPFPELNQGALSLTIERMKKYLEARSQGRRAGVKHWAQTELDPELRALILSGNFLKLYHWHVQKLASQKADLSVTNGRWVTYPKGSDPKTLAQSCHGTNWCTAGEATAQQHLQEGDFHVYYSLDATGQPTQPRLAIRMEGDQITEVRGIGSNQGLDSAIAHTTILDTKLKEFGTQGEKYKKKSADMRRLTEIERKNQSGEPLSTEELRFLYEVSAPIKGFATGKDPRIAEIHKTRNIRQDLAQALGVSLDEISLTREEALSGKIKYHYGDLDLRNLTSAKGLKLPEHIRGGLDLRGLTSAEGLKLPEHIGGRLNLRGLTSAEGLKLPEHIGGRLNLRGLTSAEGLKLPEHIGGRLDLGRLTSAKGLKLPEHIGGGLDLGSLTSAEGLKLPEHFGGSLILSNLTSAKGLKLPEHIEGFLDLSELTSAKGLKLPKHIGGDLVLRGLTSLQGLIWPERVRWVILSSKLRGSSIPSGIKVSWE